MASAYVLQTMITSTATDTRKKVTFSCWFKRGSNLGTYTQLLCNSPNPGSWDCVRINNADKLYLSLNNDTYYLTTNRVFRDVGAWYHIVARVDTTAASADRLQLWVNGVRETSFLTENQPTADYECNWGVNTQTNRLGMETWGTSQGWDGEMSHVHFCDGFAYDASDFGSFDSTSGIWKIKTEPSVSYGTNGFFLKMEDRTNLDLDSSGNAWSLSTVGTLTATYDNPSNNFATLNNLGEDTAASYTYSNALTTVDISSGWCSLPLTLGAGAGKWYFEAKLDTLGNYAQVGWATNDWLNKGGADSYFGTDSTGTNLNSSCGMGQDGPIYNSTTAGNQTSVTYGDAYVAGKYIGCALDLDNGFAYWSIDGVWQNSGVPTSGGSGTGAFTIDNPTAKGYLWLPGVAANTAKWSINTGNGYFGTTLISSPEADDGGIGAFKYDVPAGYRVVCTKNIKAYG